MNRNVQIFKNKAKVADKVMVAESFLTRLQGMIGRKAFEPGFGMLFPKCNDIHMWFMSLPLDVVFLKKEKAVVDAKDATVYRISSVHENVQPWRVLPLVDFRASDTLELPVGVVRASNLCVGDELEVNNV